MGLMGQGPMVCSAAVARENLFKKHGRLRDQQIGERRSNPSSLDANSTPTFYFGPRRSRAAGAFLFGHRGFGKPSETVREGSPEDSVPNTAATFRE
jgi:hypothetical protein